MTVQPTTNGHRDTLDDFAQSLQGLVHPKSVISLSSAADAWRPSADIHQSEQRYLLEIELPGFDPEDLAVGIENDELTIQCVREPGLNGGPGTGIEEPGDLLIRRERRTGRFVRHFRIPPDADQHSVTARLKNGILWVTLPRTSAAETVTHVEVR